MNPELRAAWYRLYEPRRLKIARFMHEYEYVDDEPLVSVLLPTHNRADLLVNRALASVFIQTYDNMEIVVLAHNCTDDTISRVKRLRDHRIRLVEVKKRGNYPDTAENRWFCGPVEPLNVGLGLVKGQWIARIDDDDVWTQTHVENLLGLARKGDFEFVSGAHNGPHGVVRPYRLGKTEVGGTQTWLYRSYLRFFRYNPDCWRKRWNRVNDTDIQDRMYSAGVRIGYLNKVVCDVLPRPGETEIGLKAYLSPGNGAFGTVGSPAS